MMQTIKMEKWLISRVEILKMASKMVAKMATSNALNTFLTNKLDKKHLIWTFCGCLKAQ